MRVQHEYCTMIYVGHVVVRTSGCRVGEKRCILLLEPDIVAAIPRTTTSPVVAAIGYPLTKLGETEHIYS